MNHVYVLRKNREAGPFTPAELKAYGLSETDLLWVDGESKEWKHPSEIEGMETAAPAEPKAGPQITKKVTPVASTVPALPEKPVVPEDRLSKNENAGPSCHTHQNTALFHRNGKHGAIPYTTGARFFGAVVLLTGLALCGFVVVNMLTQFDTKPAAVSEAVEIRGEPLPASNTAHTAEAPQTEKPSLPARVADGKDSVLDKAGPEKKQPDTVAAAKASKAKKANKNALAALPVVAAEVPEAVPPEAVDEKPEPAKAASQPPSLQLSANDYKVGLFGGISDLEITVANPSGQSVGKAVVEIEFLKPNGNVVRTQTVTAENLPAGSSKTVAVPSSGRGVKVRYRVASVE